MTAHRSLAGPLGASDDLLARLRRIEGQVRGIQRMIDTGANCSEVLTQVAAARAALDSVGVVILERRLHTCLDGNLPSDDVLDVFTAVERMVRR